MDIEYKITFALPSNYDASRLFKQLPSPIEKRAMAEIYNYRLEQDGFYFVDRRVNPGVASFALRCFIDEALRVAGSIEISQP